MFTLLRPQGFGRAHRSLPYSVSISDVNRKIVDKLGEPDSKGSQCEGVWIAYSSLGLQFDFASKSWEDTNNPITCVTVFQPVARNPPGT